MSETDDTPLESLEGVDQAAAAPDVATPPVKVALIAIPGGIPNMNEQLEEVHAEAARVGVPIRLRMPINVYSPEKGIYMSWQKVAWILEFAEVEEVIAFREHLEAAVREFVEGRKR